MKLALPPLGALFAQLSIQPEALANFCTKLSTLLQVQPSTGTDRHPCQLSITSA